MGRIDGRETEERASLGDEDLILSQVTSGSVVFAMCDTPRVEWNSETNGELTEPDGVKKTGEDTYPEWRNQPTVLLTSLDSE